MTDVMKFFQMKAGEFRAEWAKLTDADKAQLKAGVTDGTLSY